MSKHYTHTITGEYENDAEALHETAEMAYLNQTTVSVKDGGRELGRFTADEEFIMPMPPPPEEDGEETVALVQETTMYSPIRFVAICADVDQAATLLDQTFGMATVEDVKEGVRRVTCRGYKEREFEVAVLTLQKAMEALVKEFV